MGEFLGWQSYDLQGWCEVCGFYDLDFEHEHENCQEEEEEEEEE